MISLDKQYKTKDGIEVRIYAVDGDGDYPIHGAYRDIVGNWNMAVWTREGLFNGHDGHCLNLVEIPQRIKRTVWLNVYENSYLNGCYYDFKIDADRSAGHNRIACIKVDIDCAEGDGLDE